jgi:YVTN family beta-propeller protein
MNSGIRCRTFGTTILTILFAALFSIAPHAHAATLISTIPVGHNPLYITTIGTMLYVINPADATVSAIQTNNSVNSVTSISVPGITFSSKIYAFGQKVYVSLPGSNSVSIIDPTNANAVTPVAMNSPRNFFGLGSKVYVTNGNANTITALDTATNATSSIVVGNHPLPITAIGLKLYVGNSVDNSITIVDTASGNATSTVNLGGTQSPSQLKANGTQLYIGAGGTYLLSIMDTANGNATSSVNLATTVDDMAALGNFMYVVNNLSGTVVTMDTAHGNATTSMSVGAAPESIIPIGTKLYVSSFSSPVITVIDSANGNATSSIVTPNNTQLLANIGIYLYASTVDNNVYAFDINTTPAAITETVPVPSIVDGSAVTYSYTTTYPVGEVETLHITGCSSGIQVGATAILNATTSSITLSNYTRGVSYHCTVYVQDQAGNVSNTLNIGPFIWPAAITPQTSSRGRSSGTQHTAAQLLAMGIIIQNSSSTQTYTSVSTTLPHLALGSTTPAGAEPLLTKDMTLGVIDPQVAILQHFLNTHGFSIANKGVGSRGKESTYFGSQTKKAVAAYQKAKGITPAAGFLGAVTRANINAIAIPAN